MKFGLLTGCISLLGFFSINLLFAKSYSTNTNKSTYYPDNDSLIANQKLAVKNSSKYINEYTLHKKASKKILYFSTFIKNLEKIKLRDLSKENIFQQEIIKGIFKVLGLPSQIEASLRGDLIYSKNEFDFLLNRKNIDDFNLQLNYADTGIIVTGKFYNIEKDGKYSTSSNQYYVEADTIISEPYNTIYHPHPQILSIQNDYVKFKYNKKERLEEVPYKEYFHILNEIYNFKYDFDSLQMESIERFCHCRAPGMDRRYEIELMHNGLFRDDVNIMFTTDRYYRPLWAHIYKKEKIWSEEFGQYVFKPEQQRPTKALNPNIYIKNFNYHLRHFSLKFNSKYVYGKPVDNINEALKHIKNMLDFDEANFSLTPIPVEKNYAYQLMYNGYAVINEVWNICLENCDNSEGCGFVENANGKYPEIDSINIETKISKQKANKIAGKLIANFIENCDDICHYYWCDKAAEIPKPTLGIIYFENKFHFVYQYFYERETIWDSKQILINANDGSILKNQFN